MSVKRNEETGVVEVQNIINPELIPDYDEEVRVLADANHLLKNLRMALINWKSTGFRLPHWLCRREGLQSDHVTVDNLKELVDVQEELPLEDLDLCPNLSSRILNPGQFEKMKVAPARHIFDNTVSSGLRTLIRQGFFEDNDSAEATAWFLEWVQKLQTLLSSRGSKTSLSHFDEDKYLEVREFLSDAIQIWTDISIGDGVFKPVQTGYILTITTILDLAEFYLDERGHLFW